MSKDPVKELFRKAAFVWGIIVVINIVVLVSFVSEGLLNRETKLPMIWVLINFIPLTMYLLYVHLLKTKYDLVAKGNPWVIKTLFPLFGILCIACLFIASKTNIERLRRLSNLHLLC